MHWFNKISITKKIIIFELSLILLLGLIGVIAYSNINKAIDSITNIYEQELEPIKWINTIRAHSRANEANMLKLIVSNDQVLKTRTIEDIQERTIQTDVLLENLSSNNMDSYERTILNEIKQHIKAYRSIRAQVIKAAEKGNRDQASNLYLLASVELDEANNDLKMMSNYESAKAAQFRDTNRAYANWAKYILLSLLALTIVLSSMLGVIILKNIILPLSVIISKIQEVANGNLNVEKVKIRSHDEIGKLGLTLNLMIDKLHDQVEFIKQNALKEKLTRETLSDIRVSQSLDEVFKYLISRLAYISNADRVFYCDTPIYKYERSIIKYELNKTLTHPDLKHSVIPEFFDELLTSVSKTLDVFVINDTREYYKDNTLALNFFEKYKINSAVFIPLIEESHNIRVPGVFILTSFHFENWSKESITFLKSIVDSAITPIWEIKQRDKVEELRNTFMLTLAHDLQVPLVGEQKALEFLHARPDEQPIGKYKEMITATLDSNKDLSKLLDKLLDIYNYEAGKKSLTIEEININEIIATEINIIKNHRKKEMPNIDTRLQTDISSVKLDKEEISKVLYTFLDNAITNLPKDGEILVKTYKMENQINVCVSDNGPGIPGEIREKLFERYAMAQAIERKIGAGLGLYLAKQIIEAHKGKIWFTTEAGKGTTFCFSIPI